MNKKTKELFTAYLSTNVSPILVDFILGDVIPSSVLIPSTIFKEDLVGKYVGVNYVAPSWFLELTKDKVSKILVIDKIDEINKENQLKFLEILKYRKISTFELPENCIIILTAKTINKNTIHEEIYSLVSHVKEVL